MAIPLQHPGLCHKLTYQRILEASFVFHLEIHRGMPHLKGNKYNQGAVTPVESEIASLLLIFDHITTYLLIVFAYHLATTFNSLSDSNKTNHIFTNLNISKQPKGKMVAEGRQE